MKKVLLPACFIAIIFLSACGERGVDYDTTIPVVQPNTLPSFLPGTIGPSKNIITDSTAATTNQQVPSVAVPSNTAKNTTTFNPPHGQPNHRCDIAVGAPLNSPAPQIQPSPAPPIPLPNTGGTVTLNPAHGMPGHDCAIAVGQPLKG